MKIYLCLSFFKYLNTYSMQKPFFFGKTNHYFSLLQSPKKQDRRDIKKDKMPQKTKDSTISTCAYVWRLCACGRGSEEAACRKQRTCVANPSPDSSSSTPLMFHSFPPLSSSSLSNLAVPGLTRPYPAGARPQMQVSERDQDWAIEPLFCTQSLSRDGVR